MSFRRVGWLAAIALATLLCISCGQVYRPVVIPVATAPPNPAGFHEVFGISSNVPFNQGTALQIDVAGDSDIGAADMGVNPTHAVILPNNARVFVASAGSMFAGDVDTVTAFTPASDSPIAVGLGTPTTFSLPNVLNGFTCSYLPDFVATVQTTFVYVANYGVEGGANCNLASTDSVAILNPGLNTVGLISYLPAGSHPIAMAETADTQNLYVLNAGTNSITNLSPTDLSTRATIAVPSGSTIPTWIVARPDSQRAYVVTQGDGSLLTINTSANVVTSSQPVGGPGANFVLYDNSRNRLYVVNPVAGAVFVFDATADPPAPIGSATGQLSIPSPPIPASTPPCVGTTCTFSAVTPVSVAALPDASRFYVASYVTSSATSPCPDPNLSASQCVIPQVTVFDAASLTVKSTVFPLLTTIGTPAGDVQPFAFSPTAFCIPSGTAYTPTGTARFRMFVAASADSSHVYASVCDGGQIADINASTTDLPTGGTNTPDTLVTDLAAPFSAASPGSNGEPPPQFPIFLLTGQ